MNTQPRKPAQILLTIAFVAMVSAYSLEVIDFNLIKDAVLALTLIAGSVFLLKARPTRIVLPYAILAAMSLVLLSALFHLAAGIGTTILVTATCHYFLILCFIVGIVNILAPEDKCDTIQHLLITSAVTVSCLAWVQYFQLAPALFPVYPDYNQPIYSVFGNQNLLGGFIAIAIPILVYKVSRSASLKRVDTLILLLLISTCLISGSRSAWLAAAVGSVAAIPHRSLDRRHVALAAAAACVGLSVVFLNPDATIGRILISFSDNDSGLHTRLWIWSGAALCIRDYFLTGVGPGMFQYWSPQYLGEILHTSLGPSLNANFTHTLLAHSTPLDLIVEFGLLGALPIGFWLRTLLRHHDQPEWGSALALTVYALFNTITHSTPHLLAGLLLWWSLSESRAVVFKSETDTRRILAPAIMLITALGLSAAFLMTSLIPNLRFTDARHSFTNTGASEESVELYRQAAQISWAHPKASLEYGIVLLNSEPERARAELERASRSIDTGDLHLALGKASIAANEKINATAHTERGLQRWPRYLPGWKQLLMIQDEQERPETLNKAKDVLNEDQLNNLKEYFESH
jgi:O-antigen ligase